MRKRIIAGNWKMFNDITETQNLLSKITSGLSGVELNCEVVVCPPFTSLTEAGSLLKGSKIKTGAQNIYFEENGAFTGEISAKMILSAGCEFVILGHSERRQIFKENNEMINKKLKKAIQSGLRPIFCIGETLEEREKNVTNHVIEKQLTEGLKEISAEEFKVVVIAYEPVWAIGTGKNATPEQAQEVHEFIRNLVEELYNREAASAVTIQYGGSVKPENAKELLSQKDIDGALIGGASLKADSFIEIIKAA
jgi:triosephosphate isomerase (TIM)